MNSLHNFSFFLSLEVLFHHFHTVLECVSAFVVWWFRVAERVDSTVSPLSLRLELTSKMNNCYCHSAVDRVWAALDGKPNPNRA